MAKYPTFQEPKLQALCDVLGATETGLTGSEIGQILSACRIDDPHPGHTKRHRLFEALQARQTQDQCSNAVLNFVQQAMDPVRYRDCADIFNRTRHDLNEVLAFAGWQLGEDGRLHAAERATTLAEAQDRAGRLRSELRRRTVHPDVLKFCSAELLQENYFHAVLEATKSVSEKIRQKSGLEEDGARLVDAAFGRGSAPHPLLAFNSLRTDTEWSEHKGLVNLLKGALGTFRNPTAHAPKIMWDVQENDALDVLTLLSMLHRRLDDAVPTRPGAHQP